MNTDKLKNNLPDIVIAQLPLVIEQFNCNTPLRLAHFLAQCAHESAGFKVVEENLNYSATRLIAVFPRYFNPESARRYAHNREAIGNIIYANRMGNGNAASGEGFAFFGRGYIQLTGKNNYKKFSDFIGEDVVKQPDLVATKYPLLSAAFFFNDNNLWKWCDVGSDTEAVKGVTKRVNGGLHGLSERIVLFNKFYKDVS